MALPGSGSIGANQINLELQRGATAPFSMNGAAERDLAGKPSGSISFSDFHGKSSELVRTLNGGNGVVTLESLFTAPEWASGTKKRVILPSGNERGNSLTLAAAVSIGPTAWGGDLIFDVNGIISGKGGAANSGAGGDAFNANRLGATGQKIKLNYPGTIRGGGGGGGLGGTGGAGLASSAIQEGPYWQIDMNTYNVTYGVTLGSFMTNTISWGAVANIYNSYSVIPTPYYHSDGWAYHTGANTGGFFYDDYMGFYGYYVYRTRTTSTGTTGGSPGAGGLGEGYGQARSSGAAGSAGGANAGAGGSGALGGLFGQPGGTGSPGSNGNAGAGSSGLAGGPAGYAIANIANVTVLSSTGSLLGRT